MQRHTKYGVVLSHNYLHASYSTTPKQLQRKLVCKHNMERASLFFFATEVLAFGKSAAPIIKDLFQSTVKSKPTAGRLAQSLFFAAPAPREGIPSFHPPAITSTVLANVASAPRGMYVCAEPSGCGKSSIFQIAAAKTNGLKYIPSKMLRGSGDFTKAFLSHLDVPSGKLGTFCNN